MLAEADALHKRPRSESSQPSGDIPVYASHDTWTYSDGNCHFATWQSAVEDEPDVGEGGEDVVDVVSEGELSLESRVESGVESGAESVAESGVFTQS